MNLPPDVDASMTEEEIVEACIRNGSEPGYARAVARLVKGYDPSTELATLNREFEVRTGS